VGGRRLVSYSLLTRSLLADRRPSFSWLLRSDLTGLGLSHVLPAGAATAGALRYKLLRQGGAPPRTPPSGWPLKAPRRR